MLAEAVHTQFERAIRAGLEALATELTERDDGAVPCRASRERFEHLIQSPEVATELSKLLDPGFEVIDTVALSHSLAELLTAPDPEERLRLASEGWKAFLRSFWFASMSSPDLREFIRASHEAARFRASSDVAEALEALDRGVSAILRHQNGLQTSMRDYTQELAAYRDWARTPRQAN